MHESLCPLCGSEKCKKIYKIGRAALIASWLEQFGIDLSDDIPQKQWIDLFQCQNCLLKFFPGDFAGGEQLYQALQQRPEYYKSEKWDYVTTLRDIQQNQRVLDVGCGKGDFIAYAMRKGIRCIQGIELNSEAVAEAKRSNLPVELSSLQELSAQHSRFDVVCAIQVLEHVPNPHEFLVHCLDLLNPQGKLLLCVPNDQAYIGRFMNGLLNSPPHHITRWSAKTFDYLPKLLPVQVERVAVEPLARNKVSPYILSKTLLWDNSTHRRRAFFSRWRKTLEYLLGATPAYALLPGHTLYIALRKKEDLAT